MLKLKSLIVSSIIAATLTSIAPPKAEAGPLLDWLLGRHRRGTGCTSCLSPAQACAPTCPQPQVCAQTCSQTCQRVVVNYVPYTAYRTDWEQVPVTQYQQTCSTDPCTGCPVTCMKPCTTYTWQMKRVPYTTYRPVYRTESYTVPITYQAPPAPCGTCNTCATCPTYATAPTTAMLPQTGCATCGPSYSSPVVSGMPTILPNATLSPGGTYTITPNATESTPYYQPAPVTSPSTLPADQVPSLGNRPILLERREVTNQSSTFQAPPLMPTNTSLQGVRPIRDPNPQMRWNQQAPPSQIQDQTAAAPTHRRWEYSPVRLASHTQIEPVERSVVEPREYRGDLNIESRQPGNPQANSAWRNAN